MLVNRASTFGGFVAHLGMAVILVGLIGSSMYVTCLLYTSVMVTHDLEAASMADRILVLRDGRVAQELGRSAPARILAALEDAEVPA